MSGERGVSRVITKLKNSIEAKNFYEAHQMYRTIYYRYCAQSKYKEALDLMYEGATTLLSEQQQTSGADLSLLYLEILDRYNISIDDNHIKNIVGMFSLMKNSIQERQQFLIKAIKLSVEPSKKLGNEKLHLMFAQIFWKEKNYTSASYHFLRSDDGKQCALMLVELHLLRGYPCEVDLFITQAVLQFLCLQKQKEASQAFDCYTKKHPNIRMQNGPPFLLPLINFLWLLLKAIDNGKASQFNVLCEQYKPSLKRDPSYTDYLSKIGNLFFNIPVPINQSSGLLGNFLEGIFNSLAEDPVSEEAPDLD